MQVPRRVSRWNRKRFPLHVSLGSAPPPKEIERAEFEQTVREALAAWSGAIDGELPTFDLKTSSMAELPVRWVDELQVTQALGEMSWTASPGYAEFKPEAIELPRHRPDSAEWTAASLRHVLVHEFGHSLGILGHSDDAADVMYAATGAGRGAPTKRDLNTLRMLYACPRDALLDP